MLGRGRGLGGFLAVTLVEAIDASCGIDELLFARKERMASRTNFDVQVTFARRARFERLAARAGDVYFVIFGMNSWFHTDVIIGFGIQIVKFGQDLRGFSGFTGFLRVSFPKDSLDVALDVSIYGGGVEPL